MGANATLPGPPLEPPLQTAVAALAKLETVEETARAVWQRLKGEVEAFGLPPLDPREELVDIFVQVYEYGNHGEVARRLPSACVLLLKREQQADLFQAVERFAVAELCYLSARIQVRDAISPLVSLAQREDARTILDHGETLRVRILGCLVGILGAYNTLSGMEAAQLEPLFQDCLQREGCELIALTGLIGLWPERRAEFIRRLPLSFRLDERLLNVNLALAGFVPIEALEASVTPKPEASVTPKESTNTGDKPPVFVGQLRVQALAASGILTRLAGEPVEIDRRRSTAHGETSLLPPAAVSRSVITSPDLPFPDFISYGRCETFAESGGDANAATATAWTSVERVRVTTRPTSDDRAPGLRSISLRADRLSLAMKAVCPSGQQPYFQMLSPETLAMSLIYTPMAGSPVEIPLTVEFDRGVYEGTLADLDAAFRHDRNFFDRQVLRLGHKGVTFGTSMPRTRSGHIATSVIKSILRGDTRIEGHILRERGFGTIHFGEMIADDYSRQITLARIQMGSDPEGHAAFASVLIGAVGSA